MDARCDRCQQPLPTPDPGSGGEIVCPHCGHTHAGTGIDVALDDELGQAFENVFLTDEEETDPASMEWYVAIEGQQVGPVSFADIAERWARGLLGPDSLCWRAGLSDWVPIGQLPELVRRLPPVSKSAPHDGASGPKAEMVAASKASGTSAVERKAATPAAEPNAPAAAEAREREWRPTAAVALEALVEKEVEEAEKRQEEAPAIPDPETTGIRVVLRDLPEPPPPEPSKFIPIPKNVPAPAPAPAPRVQRPIQTAAREPKPGRAPLFIALAAVLLGGGAAAAYFAGLLPVGALGREAPPEPAVVTRAEPSARPEAQPQPTLDRPEAGAAGSAQGEAVAANAGGGGAGAQEKQAGQDGQAGSSGQGGSTVASAEKDTVDASADRVEASAEENRRTQVAAKAPTPRAAPEPRRTPTAARPVSNPRESTQPPAPAPAPAPAPESTQPSGKRDLLAAGKSSSIDALFEKEMSKPAPRPAERKGSEPYIPPPPGSGVQKPLQLGQGDIMSVVAGHRAELRACANRYKEQGGSSGSVVMSWVIEPDGRTSNVKAVKGQEHAGMVRCLEEQIRTWKFPSYSGPRMQPIEFPFQF